MAMFFIFMIQLVMSSTFRYKVAIILVLFFKLSYAINVRLAFSSESTAIHNVLALLQMHIC